MAAAKTILKNSLLQGTGGTLAEAMARANDQLVSENEAELFVTVFVGILDLVSGDLVYVNAGHNPPLLLQGESAPAYLPLTRKSPVLGMMDGIPYQEMRISLGTGDRLFLYTDGITEAMDERKQMFSKERLEKALSLLSAKAAPVEILENVFMAVRSHAGGADQSDDMTVMAVTWNKISPDATGEVRES